MSSYSLVELQNVSLESSFGDHAILRDISFAVHSGEKIAIAGASGSGKTSLLRLCNCLHSPTFGEIIFAPTDFPQESMTKLRQKIVLVPQEPKLLGMSVQEALIYPLKLQQLSSSEIKQRVATWSEALNIPEIWLERHEFQLSLGQRQLVAIARALVMEPLILLLDEPTSALDIGTSDRLLSVLNSLVANHKMTIIMVNHQLELSAKFAERILYLENGTLIEDTIASTAKWQQLQEKLLKIEN
ncbi:MAG: ATP-binding cassette domain-containing protein [Cyanobacteria bacterium P01_F01_bin.143]